MKQHFALMFTGIVLAAIPSAALAESFQSFFKAEAPKVVKAFETRDAKFFEDIWAPGFTGKGPQGTMSRSAALKEMKQSFAAAKDLHFKIKILSMTPSGTAVIWTKADMVMKLDKQEHSYSAEEKETQTWIKMGSTWKLKTLVEGKPEHVMMDGKPAPASAVGG